MNIELKTVIPLPLAETINPKSDIWNKDLIFEAGQHYLIDAQSGKGKSTFVQCVYGMRWDYSGYIIIGGSDVRNVSKDKLAKWRQSELSIQFQDLRLFLDLSAYDNIQLNKALAANAYAEKIDYMAEKLSVTHLLGKTAGLLSYGERQRISLIRALVQPFKWILLDEPFSHLDKHNTQACFDLLLEVSESEKAGIILTSLGEDNFIQFKNHLYI